MKKRAASAGVQLFSFLDAMICTMGALLVLLHAFARHGQIEAVHKAETRTTVEGREDPEAERDTLEWRTAQLKESRAKTEAQLAEERLKLSHVEDHERRLRDKFQQLRIAAAELERLNATNSEHRQQDVAQFEDIQHKLYEARQAVKNARRRGQEQASYSVVPYEGPNSTRRRPIYIECRANSIVLQPENIELAPEDFAGFLGPGNPLASALRGTREYYARQARGAKDAGEPYPLMLVRPDGIEAYYAARSALDSWGSEFGYELVGADWQLTFPDPDPQLADLTRQAVADARVRMRELAMTSPQLIRNRSRTTLHASSRGGFVADRGSGGGSGRGSGGSGESGPGGWDALGSNWARRGNGFGSVDDGAGGNSVGGNGAAPGDSLTSAGGNAGGSSLADSGYGNGAGPTTGAGRYASGSAANGTTRYGQAGTGGQDANPSGGTGGDSWDAQQGSRAGGENGGQAGRPAGSAGGSSQGQSGGQGGPAGGQGTGQSGGQRGQAGGQNAGQSGGQPGGSAGGTSSTASDSASGSTGGASGSSGSASASSGGASGSSGGSDSAQGAAAGMPSPTFHSQSKKTTPLSKTRGRDWGLPDGGVGVAAATRPILVECHNDRLVILPEDRNQEPKVVRLGTQAQETIDEFVSDVWQHMKGWGIAGKGLYWRPTLVMDVKPGAADRYAEVKSLLTDSGLDVHERQPRAAAQPPARTPTRK
jgi:hypothetical protein